MAYDTTLHDRLPSPSPKFSLREGYVADWGSRCFPRTTAGGLAVVLAVCMVFLLAGLAPLGGGTLWRDLQEGRNLTAHLAGGENQTSALGRQGLLESILYGVYCLGGWDGLSTIRSLALAALFGSTVLAIGRRGVGLLPGTLVTLVGFLAVLPLAGDPRPALLLAPLLPLGLLAAERLSGRRRGLFWCWLSFFLFALALLLGLPASGRLLLMPLEATSLAGMLFFLSWIPAMIVLRRSPRTVTVREALLLVGAAAAALLHREALLAWVAVGPWVLAPHAVAAWQAHVAAERTNRAAAAHSTRTLIAMAAVFATLLLNPATSHLVSGHPRAEGRLVADHGPLEVADELQRRGLAGICLAPADWSDYLAWHSDGRLVPLAATAEETRHMTVGGAYWLKIADRRGLEYLVVDRDRWPALARVAAEHPRAEILYEDERCQLVELLPAVGASAE